MTALEACYFSAVPCFLFLAMEVSHACTKLSSAASYLVCLKSC